MRPPASDDTILVGAVAYHPNAVTIWEGVRDHFRVNGEWMDFILFSNYERQVDALLAWRIDVAWNTPLAHVRVRQQTAGTSRSLAMRDADQDFRSHVVVRRDAGLRTLADLAGKALGVGSRDSTQARILPLHFLREAGVDLGQVRVLAFDANIGKHGDTGASEVEVLRSVRDGRAHAGAIGDPFWSADRATGANDLDVLFTTPPFDRCMFDALSIVSPLKLLRFTKTLFAMSWENREHRRLMELLGMKAWLPPREEGYESLMKALASPLL